MGRKIWLGGRDSVRRKGWGGHSREDRAGRGREGKVGEERGSWGGHYRGQLGRRGQCKGGQGREVITV